jgi:hypothetical protein
MTHTHTRGPWMYATGEDWDGAHVTDKNGRIVADCQGCDMPGASGEVGTDEAKANARLIAAAPEMLAALIASLDYVVLKGAGMELSSEALNELCAGIRAAISKAEGNA